MSDTITELGQIIVSRDAVIEDRDRTIEGLNGNVRTLQDGAAELNRTIEAKEAELTDSNRTIGEQQNKIAEVQTVSALHLGNVSRRNGEVSGRDESISAKDTVIMLRDATISDCVSDVYKKTTQIVTLNNVVGRQGFTVRKRNDSVSDRDSVISEKDRIIAERDATITELLRLLYPEKEKDYEVLDVLEADGTYCYNLGINASENGSVLGFALDFEPQEDQDGYYFGHFWNQEDDRDFRLFYMGAYIFDVGYNRYLDYGGPLLNERVLVEYDGSRVLKINGQEHDARVGGVVNEAPVWLLGGPDCDRVPDASKMRFYSLKLYRDGNLIADYEPVKKDGTYCLHDKVTGKIIEPTLVSDL